jgi:hypothetical protein
MSYTISKLFLTEFFESNEFLRTNKSKLKTMVSKN